MTLASDNVFPKVIMAEGAAPATPSSGQVKLYAKADGLLYSKDDAGAETLVSGGAGGLSDHDHTGGGDGGDLDSPIIDGYAVFNEESAPGTAAAATVRLYAKADGLLYSKDDAGTETLVSGGAGGGGGGEMPWRYDIHPLNYSSTTNWNTIIVGSGAKLIYNQSSGAQNDEMTFPGLAMGAGTWDIIAWVWKSTNHGIITFYLDAGSVGTIDLYNGSSAPDTRATITGITVAADDVYDLKLKMATKNASSSNYYGLIAQIILVRTA